MDLPKMVLELWDAIKEEATVDVRFRGVQITIGKPKKQRGRQKAVAQLKDLTLKRTPRARKT